MSTTLSLVDVTSTRVLDVVHISDGGDVTYDDGRAAPMIQRLIPAGAASGTEIAVALDGWSNGYISISQDVPVARHRPGGMDHDQRTHAGGRVKAALIASAGDLTGASDEHLLDLFGRISSADSLDEAALLRVVAEMERRENADKSEAWLSKPKNTAFDWNEPTPEQERIDALIEQGADFLTAYSEVHGTDPDALARQADASILDRRPGETLDKAVRRSYDEWVHLSYLEAEHASRGHMLNPAGVAAGVDPRSLFSGPLARARKYASEELMRWWTEHDRLNLTQFRAQVLHRDRDIRAAAKTKGQSNDKDFV